MTLHQWLANASPDEQRALALAAGTSVAYLRQIGAHAHASYRRTPGPKLAGRIDTATRRLGPGWVPVTELVPACAECQYARACGVGREDDSGGGVAHG